MSVKVFRIELWEYEDTPVSEQDVEDKLMELDVDQVYVESGE